MKGKFSRIVMTLVTLSLVLSAVAVAAPAGQEASAQSGGLNSWVRHDLPTTQHWQMAPNTDIWDLTAADDGTLFALVEDTSGPIDLMAGGAPQWDGLRWAVYPAWSDVALFKSTDGGYTWTLMWHMPASEDGAPIAVVPQPGYVDGDAAKGVVFIATGRRYISPGDTEAGNGGTGNIYRSLDGGNIFTRVTPRCPTIELGGTITSIDVAENRAAPGTYMAIVGAMEWLGPGDGEGVYTWNEDNDRDWRDKQVSNAMPPAPFPGTMPAGNGLDVLAVKASDSYTEDGCIMAVVNDISPIDPAGQPTGVYLCYWDDMDGAWGGDVDSPTTARLWTAAAGPEATLAACIDTADDFAKVVNNYVFVGIDGSLGNVNDDVWRIRGLSTVTGPSTATAMGLGTGGVGAMRISDVLVQGPAASGAVYVGCEFPGSIGPGTGQAQVFRGEQATLWPSWTPAFKPPSGAWPVLLADMSGTLMAAGGGDGFTYGGVHRCAAGCTDCAASQRMVFNGVGLLDDIAVSEDIPGYVNNVNLFMYGTSWCLAEAVAEEVSPTYETDKLMYVSTFSKWDADNVPPPPPPPPPGVSGPQPTANLSLWRWTDGIHWERIMKSGVTLPTPLAGGNAQFDGKPMNTMSNWAIFSNSIFGIGDWTWYPRVPRGFSTDPYVFLLGGLSDSVTGWQQEMFWYSPDKGDTWIPFDQMPIGAFDAANPLPPPSRAGLSETGWWVEDNNTIFCGDVAGWVYKTTDRGASWTEGALTAANVEVSSIVTSPIYSEAGSGDTDKCVLVGTFGPLIFTSGLDTRQSQIWLSQDGAIQDMENVGAEIYTFQLGSWMLNMFGMTEVNFDPGWANNHMAYATASGALDRWQLVGPGATQLTRIDTADVGVYRTQVNLNDPSASTWEQVWDADDFNNAVIKKPQPLTGMLPGQSVMRWVALSDLQVGNEGSIYIPFHVRDWSYNKIGNVPKPPSPSNYGANGRFTLGGVLRCLEPTQAVTEWDVIDQGLGEWDGLWLNRAVAGDSNTLISLAWDWQEWRWKLAIYDDTLCTSSTPGEPSTGDTAVGTIVGNKVSVALDWGGLDAGVYQWQIDDDCGFAAPMVKEGNTSENLITVTGLDPNVKYCWRVRALEPALSRWSEAQDFHTIMSADLNAPELISPKAGAAIAEKRPAFQWSAIGWADQYQLQVATDSDFGSSAILIDETLGNTQGYQSPTDLASGTYYWRVKAMSDTQDTWSSTGIFAVDGKLISPGPASWVWVLIVVGVVLLLVMAWVIIVKTRTTA